jgi:hypothetical protein
MSFVQLTILALFLATVCVSPARADGNIVIAAQETEATVTPRLESLRLVNLPALTFYLRAAIRCKGDPVSVTLSVADTYRTLRTAEIEGQRAAEAALTVPARQLALAATSSFCVKDNPATSDELLVPGLTTAQASLLCENEAGTSMHYASVPLQIRLICDRDSEMAQEPLSER